MKQFILHIISLLFVFSFAIDSYADDYNRDATLVSVRGPIAIVKASGMHDNKKQATMMAIKSAFHTYFYYGIDGLNNGKPLITDETPEVATYTQRFFDDKNLRFLSFVAKYEEDKNPERLPNKMYKATLTFEIYDDALMKDMLRSNVRKKTAAEKEVEEVKEEVAQPTIMVVPYKQQNMSYQQILRDTRYTDLRSAITYVQDAFIKKGYDIKDVMAVLEATEKSMMFESNSSVESFDGQLINNSGADVYVTVDAGYNTNSEGATGSISVVAYEKASGRLLTSKNATTRRFRNGTLTDLFRIAIQMIGEEFMNDITLNYAKRAELGNTFVLRVSTGTESTTDLNTDVPSLGIPLSDALRMWLRKNALNGKFHVQGSTRDLIIFDEIQVASKADAGHFIDANDFALDIYMYLRNDLGISCDKRVDGGTVYITLEE